MEAKPSSLLVELPSFDAPVSIAAANSIPNLGVTEEKSDDGADINDIGKTSELNFTSMALSMSMITISLMMTHLMEVTPIRISSTFFVDNADEDDDENDNERIYDNYDNDIDFDNNFDEDVADDNSTGNDDDNDENENNNDNNDRKNRWSSRHTQPQVLRTQAGQQSGVGLHFFNWKPNRRNY